MFIICYRYRGLFIELCQSAIRKINNPVSNYHPQDNHIWRELKNRNEWEELEEKDSDESDEWDELQEHEFDRKSELKEYELGKRSELQEKLFSVSDDDDDYKTNMNPMTSDKSFIHPLS